MPAHQFESVPIGCGDPYPAERCKRIETEKLAAGCTVTETLKVSPAASR